MKNVILNISNLSKQYRLGTIGSSSLQSDINRLWAKLKGQPDPSLKITDENILHSYDKSVVGDNHNSRYIWALNDINIKVEKGEIIGIIGANGAGKSTLLKILSRITLPTAGEIKVKGSIGSLLEVGTGFHPELTGLENIYLNGTILGMNRKQISSQLDNIIKFSGVDSFINTPLKRYSTGMKVRLGFSVAAHLEPEILIVDEVLAVGDMEFQKKAISKMSNISDKQGKTILFVSHNMQAIQSLTHRCILLEKGKIVNDGLPDTVINDYMIRSKKKENVISKQENDFISLSEIFVSDLDGNERDVFKQNNNIIIKISYHLKQIVQYLRISYMLEDKNGSIIYKTSDFIDGYRPNDLQEIAYYQTQTIIPGHLLNEGHFIINLLVETPKGFIDKSQRYVTTICKFNNVKSFRVVFTEKVMGQIGEKFPGVLFPQLKWTTKKIMN